MAKELNGCGHNVVVRNGKEGGLRVHRNVPYEDEGTKRTTIHFFLLYCTSSTLFMLTGPLFPRGIENLIYMILFCYGSSNGN